MSFTCYGDDCTRERGRLARLGDGRNPMNLRAGRRRSQGHPKSSLVSCRNIYAILNRDGREAETDDADWLISSDFRSSQAKKDRLQPKNGHEFRIQEIDMPDPENVSGSTRPLRPKNGLFFLLLGGF